jgi:hypothetical protein
MDSGVAVVVLVASVASIVFLGLTFVPFVARWSANSHAVLIRLDLPARLERSVSQRLMASGRGAAIGALVFTVAAGLFLQLAPTATGDAGFEILFVVGATIVGASAGSAITAFTGIPTVVLDKPRVARSGAATAADYLHPFDRIAARAVVTVSIVVVIANAVIGTGGSFLASGFLAMLGAISLVLFEVMSRRIVDHPQPAGSTADLVWNDAIRASTLRDLVTAPFALGAYSLILGIVLLVEGLTGSPAQSTADVSSVLSSFALIVIVVFTRADRRQRFFLRRLWPDLRWNNSPDAGVPLLDPNGSS